MKTIYQEYLDVLDRIKAINEEKAREIASLNTIKSNLVLAMYEENKNEYLDKQSGVININRGIYQIKINKKVDLVPSDIDSIKAMAPSCFTKKTTESFSRTNYNKLPVDIKEKISSFMELVEKEPTFEVKKLED